MNNVLTLAVGPVAPDGRHAVDGACWIQASEVSDHRPGPDLFVVQQTPSLGTGQAMRVYTVARALAGSNGRPGLIVAYVRFGADAPDAAFQSIPGIEFHEIIPSRGLRRALVYGWHRARRTPEAWARGISPELIADTREILANRNVRRIIADGPMVASALLSSLAGRRAVIYNAHNLESSFRYELSGQRLGSLRSAEAAERRLLARSSEAWMVSEADVAGARALYPSASIRYVPNVVDTDAIRPRLSNVARPHGLMVADFLYEPNLNALRFLVEDVMPSVWRSHPEIRLSLVGRGLEQLRPEDPRIEVRGFVPSLEAEYDRAGCALVPLMQGGGTPFKFIEALAYGVPVVATGRAAAGLSVVADKHYLRADSAAAFASAIVRLLANNDPQVVASLSQCGRELVERRYSIEALARLIAPSTVL